MFFGILNNIQEHVTFMQDAKIAVEDFVFSFFKEADFVDKLLIFSTDFDLNIFGEGWTLQNWYQTIFKGLDSDDFIRPEGQLALEAVQEFNLFMEKVVMTNFENSTWSTGYIINLIHCLR